MSWPNTNLSKSHIPYFSINTSLQRPSLSLISPHNHFSNKTLLKTSKFLIPKPHFSIGEHTTSHLTQDIFLSLPLATYKKIPLNTTKNGKDFLRDFEKKIWNTRIEKTILIWQDKSSHQKKCLLPQGLNFLCIFSMIGYHVETFLASALIGIPK